MKARLGIIAEDVEKVLPELVEYDQDNNPCAVNLLKIIPYQLVQRLQITRKRYDLYKFV